MLTKQFSLPLIAYLELFFVRLSEDCATRRTTGYATAAKIPLHSIGDNSRVPYAVDLTSYRDCQGSIGCLVSTYHDI